MNFLWNYYTIMLYVIIIMTLFYKYVLRKDVRNDVKYLKLIFAVLLLFNTFKYIPSIIDLDNYLPFFHEMKKLNIIEIFSLNSFEIGYCLYNKLIITLTDSDRIFIFCTAILSLIGVFYFIKENSKNYFLSVYLYITLNFYFYTLGVLRQSIALSCLLFSYRFIEHKKPIKYVITILIASTFHNTILICLPLYFLCNIKNKRIMLSFLAIISLIVLFLKKQLIILFSYFTTNNYLEILVSGEGYKMLLFLIILVLLCLCIIKKYSLHIANNTNYFIILSVGIITQLIATEASVAARLTIYFTVFIIVLLPNIFEELKSKMKLEKYRIIYIILILLFFLMYIYFIISNDSYII